MPIDAVVGLLAHELQHIDTQRKRGFLISLFIKMLYFLTGDLKEERETDKQIILKGFAPQLLTFHKWHNKTYEKYTAKDGLSIKEIKEL